MLDVFKVADLLVSHATETHGDEVDLICYHGSYAKGMATRRSDLDIFYTPAPGANPPVGRTVLVEGVLFDFWAVPWERLETCADGRNGVWSGGAGPLHYARLLHARSDAQRTRLEGLKQRVRDLLQPAARASMVRRALAEFKSALVRLGALRVACVGAATATSTCIANTPPSSAKSVCRS